MPVVNIKKAWSGATFTDAVGNRRATVVYTVLLDGTDTIEMAPFVARRAEAGGIRIPRKGETHPADAYMTCTDVNVSDTKSQLLWKIIVTYSYQSSSNSGDEQSPLDEPAQYSWGSASTIEPIDMDANGKAIINTAGDAFDPPIAEEFEDVVVTIRRNQATMPADYEEYQNTVNAEDVVIDGRKIRAGMGKIKISGERIISGSSHYYNVTFQVTVRKPLTAGPARYFNGSDWPAVDASLPVYAWYRRVQNRGFKEIRTADVGPAGPVVITDTDGNRLSEPAFLDVNGKAAALDVHGIPTAGIVWLLFQTKRVKSWGPLALA